MATAVRELFSHPNESHNIGPYYQGFVNHTEVLHSPFMAHLNAEIQFRNKQKTGEREPFVKMTYENQIPSHNFLIMISVRNNDAAIKFNAR